ncbi:MAG: hypothetical protein ACJAQ6_001983 [Arenicella sp.]
MKGRVVGTKTRIIDCLSGIGGNNIAAQTDDYVDAAFTSRLLRFKHDVELYIDADAEQVHSCFGLRVDYSYVGVNRKRDQASSKFYQ